MRMVHVLLDKANLQAKIERALSEPFDTNLGAPQGDSLSPVLFIIYLELAMRQLRAACPRPPEDLNLPIEAIYADDTDFISSSTEVIAAIEPAAKSTKSISQRRLRLYDAYITPILTYNACTWALTEAELAELEACRRRHLRHIIGVYYPSRISNANLYKKCNMKELEPIIRNARWRMFGHTLRMNDDIPAKRATIRFFDSDTEKFLGRPRHTLPRVIDKDLERAAAQPNQHPARKLGLPKQLKTIDDLRKLESLASVRSKWNNIVKCVMNTQVPEPKLTEKRQLRPRGDGK
jgi:hypothetical protein